MVFWGAFDYRRNANGFVTPTNYPAGDVFQVIIDFGSLSVNQIKPAGITPAAFFAGSAAATGASVNATAALVGSLVGVALCVALVVGVNSIRRRRAATAPEPRDQAMYAIIMKKKKKRERERNKNFN